jgi:predicted DNA-binding transcriptional regulator YafY
VDPYGVVYRTGRWYVPGYCHLREGLRLFRLDRVAAASLREETFRLPQGFDAAAYVQRSLATAPGAWLVRALLEAPLEVARRRVPPDQATVEETPRGVELRIYTEEFPWVVRFLVGLGLPFTVLEPPEARAALLALAEALTRAAPPAEGERSPGA